MTTFAIEPDVLNKDRYIITVHITIYRQKFGCYPDFLQDFETPRAAREGYDTKFWFIVPDCVNLLREDAEHKCNMYEKRYGTLIRNCEETGDWTNCPRTKADLIYHK